MTATTTPPAIRHPSRRDEVKKMLRDAAYVLHLTRRVKAEISPSGRKRLGRPHHRDGWTWLRGWASERLGEWPGRQRAESVSIRRLGPLTPGRSLTSSAP